MYYGNFDELRFIYAAREIPELSTYINKISELDRIKNRMTTVVATEGMKSLEREMTRAREVGAEIEEVRSKLIEKLPQLKEYKITEEDIEDLYNKGNS